jgi:hypothetical protein
MKAYSNQDKLRVLGQRYVTIADIAVLCDCGKNTAFRIRHDIIARHPNLYMGRIPTELLVKELRIPEKRIIAYARQEER